MLLLYSYDGLSVGTPAWMGILAWKNGSLLVSLLWTSMIVNVIDRQWKSAAIWAIVSSLFAVTGVIHSFSAGFGNFSSPAWQMCFGTDLCWTYTEQWMQFTAYIMMAATFVILYFVSQMDDSIEDAIDDESRHAFDDWFQDAYKYKDEHGNTRDSRIAPTDEETKAAMAFIPKKDIDDLDDIPEEGAIKNHGNEVANSMTIIKGSGDLGREQHNIGNEGASAMKIATLSLREEEEVSA
ncbi:MAG: hypothetical protein ACI90V_011845 [Bacillariaceae sp.]|jgi:hypothetical protein